MYLPTNMNAHGADLTDTNTWNDAIQEGRRGYVTLSPEFSAGLVGIDENRQRVAIDLIKAGESPENAYWDGENPSGITMYHILSPYTLGYDIVEAIEGDLTPPSTLMSERGIKEIILGADDNDDGTVTITVGFASPENYDILVAEG